jgi:hypothetical protein
MLNFRRETQPQDQQSNLAATTQATQGDHHDPIHNRT